MVNHWLYGSKHRFTATRQRSRVTHFADLPPQMTIFSPVMPIVRHFFTFSSVKGITNKRPTSHKADQSSGLEFLSHLLLHFYKLTESLHLQTSNLTVCGIGNKIYNYFSHFDSLGNKYGYLFSRFLTFFTFGCHCNRSK